MSDAAFVGSIPDLYERYLGPMLFEPYARDLARRFEGFEGDLLETAAGTGRVTRALAKAAPRARILATDLNQPMLDTAAGLTAAANVEWRQADAQALPFEGASFDAVVCQFGVMFFPDKAAGFSQARRVLRPGGRFVFNVWDDIAANEISQIVGEAVAGLFPKDPPRFLERTPFGYHDRAAIAAALAAAGFAAPQFDVVRLQLRSPSAADRRSPVLASPSDSRSTQIRPSGFSMTSTTDGSCSRVEMAGPSAVRSMRAPRSTVACLWLMPAISSPFHQGGAR